MANHIELEDIVSYLRESGWDFRILGTNTITSNVRGEVGTYTLFVVYIRDHDLIRIVVQYRDRVPAEHRQRMLSLAAAINWRHHCVTCDFDVASGIVRFRIAMPVDNVSFNAAQFSSQLAAVFALAEQSFPAIQGINDGTLSVDEATDSVFTKK